MVNQAYELPEDLICSILEYLDVKPLKRFMCLSKSWCNMITSLAFAENHYQKQRKMLLVIRRSIRRELVFSLHDDSPELKQLMPDTPLPDNSRGDINPVIIGQYYGIVFLGYNSDVILCNPAWNIFNILTPCPTIVFAIDYKFVCTRWGFQSTADSVTIVRLQHYKNTVYDLFKAYLFESATLSWRESAATYTVSTNLKLQSCNVFFNGACHWPINSISILTFNVSNEVFTVLECPNWSMQRVKGSWLKLVDDCLAMVFFRECRHARLIEIWVMKEYGVKESWTKHLVMGPYRVLTPLLFLGKDRVLMEDILSELATFCRKGKGSKRHGVYGIHNSFEALLYKDCLTSV